MSNPMTYHVSASSLAAAKACWMRFRLAYREGLRPAADTDAQRMGTNWHALHEEYAIAYNEEVDRLTALVDQGGGDDMIPERAKEAALDAAVDHLNARYADAPIPASKTPEEWETERQILLTSFIGYLWFWQEDPIEILASELAFDLPIHAPRTGLPLPAKEVVRVGKIDHVIKWRGMLGAVERKSTSSSIDPSGDYWMNVSKSTQVSMYALALRDLAVGRQLPPEVAAAGASVESFGGTLYDVWHKPTMKPSKITQADSAKLLTTGEYCGTIFKVDVEWETVTETKELKKEVKTVEHRVPKSVTIAGWGVEFEVSKTYAYSLRETPHLFAARLLADIYERPEFYYQRKEIGRTDQELRAFRTELFNQYQAQRLMETHDIWYSNESNCRATFPCQYIPICYGPGAEAVCDGKTTPAGFKRIFTDLTVNGDALTEGE